MGAALRVAEARGSGARAGMGHGEDGRRDPDYPLFSAPPCLRVRQLFEFVSTSTVMGV
jgi:hypothetical protein